MKKKIIIVSFGIIALFLLSLVPVSAKSPTPISSEFSLTLTQFTPYKSSYKLDDPLIVGDKVDLKFLKLEKTATVLSLGDSVWESDFSTVVDYPEYSLTLTNTTFNTGVTDGMTVNTQATSNSGETLVQFKATTNASAVAQYAYARSDYSYDANRDGDYVDSADKAYLPCSSNVWVLVNQKLITESNDAQGYVSTKLVFETTATADYTIEIKSWHITGDSGWDLTITNGATFNAYDANNTNLVITVPVANVLDEDSESFSIIGFDYSDLYLYADVASKFYQIDVSNIAIFTSYPAFTDSTDNDSDFDWRDTGGIVANSQDDMDRLFTVITEGTTESYDNDLELKSDIQGQIDLYTQARYLKFTGVCSVEPIAGSNFGSSLVSSGKYLTTESLIFDTRAIDDFVALSNVLSVSNWQFNVTLDDTILWDTTDYELNLVSFVFDNLDKWSIFKSAWEAGTDDQEAQYDFTDPSTSTGDLNSISMSYYTKVGYTPVTVDTDIPDSGAGITTSGSSSLPLIIILCLVGVSAFYIMKKK